MSHATSCDITQHHAIGSGSGLGAGGVRCHSTEGVAEDVIRPKALRKRDEVAGAEGSRKRKRKTGDRRKREGFPLHDLYISLYANTGTTTDSFLECMRIQR